MLQLLAVGSDGLVEWSDFLDNMSSVAVAEDEEVTEYLQAMQQASHWATQR